MPRLSLPFRVLSRLRALALLLFPLLVLFALISPSVHAATSVKLYDAWVYWGDTFDRGGRIFYIERSADPGKLLLYIDDRPYILRVGDCKQDVQGIHEKYCLEAAAYEDPDEYETYIKYESGEEYFGYHLVIYTVVPELTASRKISPASATINSRSTLTVTLENKGDEAITDITYVEPIDYPLELVPIDGRMNSTKNSSVYIYELGRLGPKQSKVFQYAVVPRDFLSATITPRIEYAYQNIKKDLTLTGITIAVQQPVTVARALSNSKATVGESISLTIELENNEQNPIQVAVDIPMPENLVVEGVTGFRQVEGGVRFEGELRRSGKEKLTVIFSAPYTGSYSLPTTVEASVGGKLLKRYFTDVVTVETEQLDAKLQLSKTTHVLRSGDSALLRVYFKNNDPKNSYVDVDATLRGELLPNEQRIQVSKVLPLENKLAKEISLVGPALNKSKSTTFELSGTYKTSTGETFGFKKTLSIQLEPSSNIFAIVQEANRTTAGPGETVAIAVTVTNTESRTVFANVYDSFSSNVPVIAGKNFAEISFDPKQERQVYLYAIQIPEDFGAHTLDITTKAYEQGAGVGSEKILSITVSDRPGEGTADEGAGDANATVSKDDVPAERQPLPEKEKYWLSKVWDWIVGLFS